MQKNKSDRNKTELKNLLDENDEVYQCETWCIMDNLTHRFWVGANYLWSDNFTTAKTFANKVTCEKFLKKMHDRIIYSEAKLDVEIKKVVQVIIPVDEE